TRSAHPGTTGITIYTFAVQQQGNKLSITDNNGSVYKGKFGSVETTGGETDRAGLGIVFGAMIGNAKTKQKK
ncbi:MAG: hypothetical protein R6U11_09940, partial [Bacteroidales bacterium]